VLTRFRDQMERVRQDELANAMRRLAGLSPAEREAVEYLSRSLMNKFLHEPSVRLRAAAANGRGLGIVDAVRYLFALEESAAQADDAGTRASSELHAHDGEAPAGRRAEEH
jgi:glutamyl-tRNA reductase